MTRRPARLHVLLARDAPIGLVIRRGPAKRVGAFGWDRTCDKFTEGQWLNGKIYERRSDLSPDGRHWIYFAMNGHWDGEGRGAWTAVARAPWLKAVVFMPKGDCWQGGGLFLEKGRYWVNGGDFHDRRLKSREVREDKHFVPNQWYGGECLTPYYNRLQRDGWILNSLPCEQQPNQQTVFEKALPKGWTLRKICHASANPPRGKGVYWEEHALVADEGDFLVFLDWEWADWVDGHLVFAEKGGLYRRAINTRKRLGEPDLIHDFNDYTFEARRAPY